MNSAINHVFDLIHSFSCTYLELFIIVYLLTCCTIILQVNLENIGAEDIVDGNPRLILGLIWTIILRSL